MTPALRWIAPAAVLFVLAVILLAPATLGGKVMSASDIPLFEPPFTPPPAGESPENPLQFDSAYVFEPDGLAVRVAMEVDRVLDEALELKTEHDRAGERIAVDEPYLARIVERIEIVGGVAGRVDVDLLERVRHRAAIGRIAGHRRAVHVAPSAFRRVSKCGSEMYFPTRMTRPTLTSREIHL